MAQRFFGFSARGDVDEHSAALLTRTEDNGIDLHDVGKISLSRERYFAGRLALAYKRLHQKFSEERAGFFRDKQPETPSGQPGAFDSEHAGAGEVYGTDNPFAV